MVRGRRWVARGAAAAALLLAACHSQAPVVYHCPEIVDAVLKDGTYVSSGYPDAFSLEWEAFPHMQAQVWRFVATADTVNHVLRVEYKRDGVRIVEVWRMTEWP